MKLLTYLQTVILASMLLFVLKGQPATAQPNWEPPVNLEFSMQVVAKLLLDFDEYSLNPDDLVGAFINDELSGVAERDLAIPEYLFLTIHSSTFNGETVTFQAYLSDLNLVVPITQTIPFIHATSVGTLSSPLILSFDNTDRTITATAGDNGSISPSGAVNVNYAQNQTFTITPDFGFEVDDVLVNDVSVGAVTQYTFVQVVDNQTIHATFKPATYWLAYIKWGDGTFIGNTWQYVEHGSNGTPVQIVPAEGYFFSGWDDGVMDNPRQETNVTESKIIVVTLGVNTYTLNYFAGANGTLSGQTNQTVQHGGNGTAVTAIPNQNYVFSHWSDQVTTNPRTDLNVTGPINVTAVFIPVNFTITASSGSNGIISPTGNITAPFGSNVTFDMQPANGYMVADVLVDDESVGAVSSYTFNSVSQNHSIHVTFQIQHYTLTYLSEPEGSIQGDAVQTVPHGGHGTPVTAVAFPGYHFDSWSDGSVMNPRVDVNITADLTVTAQYAVNTHIITATAGPNGNISPSGQVVVDEGTSQEFIITPATGHQILDVVVDGVSIGPVSLYEFVNVTEAHTIHAEFAIKTYTLTYFSDVGGSLIGDTIQQVTYGQDGTPVEAVPEPGYIFIGWSDGLNSNPRTDLNVSSNITVMAGFSADGPPNWNPPVNLEFNMQVIGLLLLADSNFSLNENDMIGAFIGGEIRGVGTPSAANDGLIFLTIGSDQHSGENITFKAYIAEQNIIVNLNQSMSFISMSEVGTLTEPFVFSYTEITYIINASAAENGTIDPIGDVVVSHWDTQGFSIIPDVGYHVLDVLVDGESIGAVDTFTFINVFQNRSIMASFGLNIYSIIATSGENGSILPSGNVLIAHGMDTTFTFVPDTGYYVYNVVVNGDSIGPVDYYTFSGVSGDQTIHVDFDLYTNIPERSQESIGIKVFPNPAKDIIFYNLTGIEQWNGLILMQLYDINGNQLRSQTYQQSSGSMGISGLPPGLYLLRVVIEDQFVQTFKLIVNP